VPDPDESSLADLIRRRMSERGWSYADLERESGRALSRGRWQQLGSGAPQRKFPDPASLQIIAGVLEVDITTVVLASARTVGLDAHTRGSDLASRLPAGTDQLSEHMRDAILTLIRAAVSDIGRARTAGMDDVSGLTLEWPKSAAPSRLRHNGPTDGSHADTQ
jgi:transcriptional regulator with XRE-family HTH domain